MTHLQLDQMYSSLFSDEVIKNYTPFTFDITKLNPTLEPKNVDAFMLNDCIVGLLKSNESLSLVDYSIENCGLIIRARVSYFLANDALKNYNQGCIIFGTIINGMLLKAERYKDKQNQQFKSVTFKSPNGSIFRELESTNAYEIRLYVKF
jgi:hypothetical protein